MIYIALLRAVNVGGNNKIKMPELKKSFERLGFTKVLTYIQSGNVLFETDLEDEKEVKKYIQEQLVKEFGLATDVILRSIDELKEILLNIPFSKEEIDRARSTAVGECLYVALLDEKPSKENKERFIGYNYGEDKFMLLNREVYLLFEYSVRNSKLSNNLSKLNKAVTTRNFNTINKLLVLAEKMA